MNSCANRPGEGLAFFSEGQLRSIGEACDGFRNGEVGTDRTQEEIAADICQRIRDGICVDDLTDVEAWFYGTALRILEAIRAHYAQSASHFYPPFLSKSRPEDAGIEWFQGQWLAILDRMVAAFKETLPDTCSRKNRYEGEFRRAWDEFRERFPDHDGPISVGDPVQDRYENAARLFLQEKDAIEERLKRNRKEAMRLLVRYLPDLFCDSLSEDTPMVGMLYGRKQAKEDD